MRRCAHLAIALWLGGCSCSGLNELRVDVWSDLAPGTELSRVRIDLIGTDHVPLRFDVDEDTDLLGGVVAGSFVVPAGDYRLRAQAFAPDGALRQLQVVDVAVREPRFVVSIRFARICDDVVCPDGERCLEGACQPCPDAVCALCESDRECSGASGCLRDRCVQGSCFDVPEDRACAASEVCLPDGACGAVSPPSGDAGTQDDAGPGAPDSGPSCVPGSCDDGDPCTDSACVGGVCEHTFNTAPCDDGVFCNGADVCSAGSCVGGGADPCPGALCDETADACVECLGAGDCPPPIVSTGSCTYSDGCDERATQDRFTTPYACVAGSCERQTTTRTPMTCATRTTEGNSCGAPTGCVATGSCEPPTPYWNDICTTSGTEPWTCDQRVCRSGTCRVEATPETRACTRATGAMACPLSLPMDCDACDAGGLRFCRGVDTGQCSGGACSGFLGSFDTNVLCSLFPP